MDHTDRDFSEFCGKEPPKFLKKTADHCPLCKSPRQEQPNEIQYVTVCAPPELSGAYKRLFFACGAEYRAPIEPGDAERDRQPTWELLSFPCVNCGEFHDWDEMYKYHQMGYQRVAAINWNCQKCGIFNTGAVPQKSLKD